MQPKNKIREREPRVSVKNWKIMRDCKTFRSKSVSYANQGRISLLAGVNSIFIRWAAELGMGSGFCLEDLPISISIGKFHDLLLVFKSQLECAIHSNLANKFTYSNLLFAHEWLGNKQTLLSHFPWLADNWLESGVNAFSKSRCNYMFHFTQSRLFFHSTLPLLPPLIDISRLTEQHNNNMRSIQKKFTR